MLRLQRLGTRLNGGVIAVDAEQFDVPKSGLLRERIEAILRGIVMAASTEKLIESKKSISELRNKQQRRTKEIYQSNSK